MRHVIRYTSSVYYIGYSSGRRGAFANKQDQENMKKLILLALPLAIASLIACGSGQSGSASTDSTASDSTATAGVVTTDSIVPYRLAENYFATSDNLPSTLTTAEELGKYLGMATSMEHTPTTIDWSREFVIPIALPPTGTETEIIPVSLIRNSSGGLTLTYRLREGFSLHGAKMRPFVALIVSRDYLAPVTLQQEEGVIVACEG